MTAASVRTPPGPAARVPEHGPADPLRALRLVLDRELVAVRRHRLRLAGRVPEQVARHVDTTAGMLEFLVDDGAGGVVVLAVAPGARGDTVVPLLPAPLVDDSGDERVTDVTGCAPFDEVVGDAVEDVSRLITHVDRPDELRGLVLHVGGRMLMVYADLWELRVTLLP